MGDGTYGVLKIIDDWRDDFTYAKPYSASRNWTVWGARTHYNHFNVLRESLQERNLE